MTQRQIIAGHEVLAVIDAHKASTVKPSEFLPGCFDSESLVAHQREISGRGFIEAEIVRSNYGYSLRYASGLHNFGLIARAQEIGGSYEQAVEYAKRWQAQDPSHRFVSVREP